MCGFTPRSACAPVYVVPRSRPWSRHALPGRARRRQARPPRGMRRYADVIGSKPRRTKQLAEVTVLSRRRQRAPRVVLAPTLACTRQGRVLTMGLALGTVE